MLTVCVTGDAAEQVRVYNGGGMTDWSLPSQDELNALYYYTGRNAIGGFAANGYWSSSRDPAAVQWALSMNFENGEQSPQSAVGNRGGVRPVRAF